MFALRHLRQRPHGMGVSYYPLRILGYAFAGLMMGARGLETGFDPTMWAFIGFCIVNPHLAYGLYRLSASNRHVELVMLALDTFWSGVFAALMGFTPLPTVALLVMTSSGNIGVRGLRQFLAGLGAVAVGVGAVALLRPLHYEPAAGLFVQLTSAITISTYTFAFAYAAYRDAMYQKRLRREIEAEKARSDELLLNILPAETADELKRKGAVEAKSYDLVTVMFTDFKDFTRVAERLDARALVVEIDRVYRVFDEIISRHHIEKIKTIGDSYMCAGGLPTPTATHAHDVVAAAREMLAYIEAERAVQQRAGRPWFDIRIGIHTGPLVAGVVGIKKFSYDIWGDTVNLASRMESAGEAGRINLSESTYRLVCDRYRCTPRGKIAAKNKGQIEMYFLLPDEPPAG